MGSAFFNEALGEGGAVRSPYGPLFEALGGLGAEGFAERKARAEAGLRELGATFPLEGDTGRILPADWVPRIVPPGHWRRLSAGLLQRGRAINAWLEDLPRQKVVPDEVLRSSAFAPPAPYARGSYPVRVYGPDVVHLGDGEYVVLEDNVRSPSGVAYAEAVRTAGKIAFEEAYSRYAPEAVAPYYDVLRATLEAAAPAGEEPSVAVLTNGPDDPAFFEHERISAACGLRLLGPGDAVVEGGALVAKGDGRAFNVAYRRLDEEPMQEAFPGLVELFEAGGIALANAPGVGLADDKGVFPHVPDMIRHYLGEEPLLGNARTYPLAEPEGRAGVLDRLDELVLKPREGYGGHGVLVGSEASPEQLREAAREVEESPEGFVAQKTLDFSTHVLDGWFGGNAGGENEAFVDLRAFVLPEAGHVLPGGLTRVARPGTRVVNSSSGGSFKDTWVLGDPRLCGA